jgi:protein-disulfide isomerase
MAAAGSALALGSAAPGAAQSLADQRSEVIDDLPSQAWLSVTERTERGHRMGNPEAEAHLIEFISYTCSHCAAFAKQSDGTLDVAAVGPGEISVEVRPVIRNYLDLVVSLLVQCGDADGFKGRHRAFLYSQDTWLPDAVAAPAGQQQIWARGTPEARVNAARALGFDDIMRDQGYSITEVDQCLRDQAAAETIVANDQADRAVFGIKGTPTFALDGETLTAGDWPSLSRTLQERFRPDPQESVSGG